MERENDSPACPSDEDGTEHMHHDAAVPVQPHTSPDQDGPPVFGNLPLELRFKIYEYAIQQEIPPRAVRTLGYNAQNNPPTFIRTRQICGPCPALFKTCYESRVEAERHTLSLPTYFMDDPGETRIHISQPIPPATRGPRDRAVGPHSVARDTHFFMEAATLGAITTALTWGRLRPDSLGWLTNLVVDKNCFAHLVTVYGRPPYELGTPFTMLPALRRVVVVFMCEWRNVALLEGLYDNVLKEMEIVDNLHDDHDAPPQNADSEPAVGGSNKSIGGGYGRALRIPRHIILETVNITEDRVQDLRNAGLEVIWALVLRGYWVRRQVELYGAGPYGPSGIRWGS